jgi:hypothetical protein
VASGSFHDGFYGPHQNSFYGVTDAVDVLVEGVPSEEAFGTPSVVLVVNDLGIASGEAFGTPTLQLFALPASVPSEEAVGQLEAHFQVDPVGIASDEAFGVPATFGDIVPVGIASGEAFGTPKVRLFILPGGIASTEGVSEPDLRVAIRPAGIPTAGAVGTPKANAGVHVAAIASSEAFGTPRQGNAAGVSGIPSAEAFGHCAVELFIEPAGVPSAGVVGQPSIGVHLILPTGIQSAELVGGAAVAAESEWWSAAWRYRRCLVVEAPSLEMLPLGHPVEAEVPYLAFQGKVRSDFGDLEVLHRVNGNWTRVGRHVEEVDGGLRIRFLVLDEVLAQSSDDYYLYYGAPEMTGAGRPAFIDNVWPVHVGWDDVQVGYTRPSEDWKNGRSERTQARVTLEFAGTDVRVLGTVGPDAGRAAIRVDEDQAVIADLYSSGALEGAEIFVQHDLAGLAHKLRLTVLGGRPGSAGRVTVEAFEYVAPVTVSDMGEEVLEDAWESLVLVGEI